ncbi:MAG: hypothetical protein V4813_18990 [Gemmatimonadota bacterium]
MSARTERTTHRRGIALLLALVTVLVGGSCALALWHTRAAALRTLALDSAVVRAATIADTLLLAALAVADTGGWRQLTAPADVHRVIDLRVGAGVHRADIARVGWSTLLVRGAVSMRSGVPGLPARAEHRLLIPLVEPLRFPLAPLTGAQPWQVDAAAVVELTPTTLTELACRAGVVPIPTRQDSLVVTLDSTLVSPLDPDTVSSPVHGVFRLTRDRISRPLVITGMVEAVTGLHVGADLLVTGVLVVRGSVVPAGGRLHVTGAVLTGDAGGAPSSLGTGDRVRYDACAIRHAVARATRPGHVRTWSTLRLF